MASTYPVEVVEAERWLKENENLQGDLLDQALQGKDWDSSVKTLCHFPSILYSMSDDLQRTTMLGDAFLAQQDDVMNMIQQLRERAREEGNLKTTAEQSVSDQAGVITIEPANPQIIYLPVYNPLYVYGPWWYPGYPPYSWYYPPGGVITAGYISFGFGIFLGAGIYTWCWPDWHHHRIDIDLHRTGRFNRFDRGRWDFNRNVWRHNPVHRRGAAYRSAPMARRFGEPIRRMQRIKPQFRGYEGTRRVEPQRGTIKRREVPKAGTYRPAKPSSGGTIKRREVPSTGAYRPAIPMPPSGGTIKQRETPKTGVYRPAIPMPSSGGTIEKQRAPSTGIYKRSSGESLRGKIFQGVGQGNFERRSSQRGFESRQGGRTSSPAGGIRSGGARGSTGGGRSGGGSRGGGFRR